MSFEALIWKYGQGVLDAHIDNKTNEMVIDKWRHPTLPKPTKVDIKKAMKDHKEHKIQQEQQEAVKLVELKQKLNLNDEEFKTLKNAMRK